jgi:hypothetical protein
LKPAPGLAAALAAGFVAAAAFGASAAAPAPAPCAALNLPRRLTTAPVELPASFVSARLGGIVVDEGVVGADGKLSQLRLVRARVDRLAPFARKSVQDSRFGAASIDGHPVATRVQIATTLGIVATARVEPEYDLVWAHVAAGQSREAQWQLARSVESLTLTAHLGTAPGKGGELVARAPGGKAMVLLRIPPAEQPIDVHETVSTGGVFDAPGDYRLELRAGDSALAWTTLTIADDYTRAIVNACRPL